MNLIQAMQTEYSRCKRLLYCCAFPISIALFAAAVIGCFPVAGWVTNTLAITVVVAQVALFVLRTLAAQHQGRAEEIRRMAMLQDGLGMQSSAVNLARLHEIIGDFNHREPAFLQPYYASKVAPGPHRLLEITEECAFFTGGNARRFWKIIAGAAAVGLLSAIIAFVAAVLSGASDTVLETAAKIILASMAFWAAGDFATIAVSFKSLATSSESVLRGCEQALAAANGDEAAQQSALALFAEYNCALAQSPPIPAWIYRQYQDRMNTAWRVRQGGGPVSSQPAAAEGSSGQA